MLENAHTENVKISNIQVQSATFFPLKVYVLLRTTFAMVDGMVNCY